MAEITVKLYVGEGKYCFNGSRNCQHMSECGWCRIFHKDVGRSKTGAYLRLPQCKEGEQRTVSEE